MGETAQKICNLDHAELLNILRQAFAEEWLAYYQYWIGAQVVEGPKRISIQNEFMKHAKEELEHAEWLATRIIQLGGTLVLDPDDWSKIARCKYVVPNDKFATMLLKQNLASERCAILRYQEICDICFGKDYETFKIAEKILHQELDHEQDWEDFLADIDSEGMYFNSK